MGRIAAEVERGLRRRGFAELADSAVLRFRHRRRRGLQCGESGSAGDRRLHEPGYSARLISRFRPPVKIIAMTYSLDAVRRLLVNYAVTPFAPEVPPRMKCWNRWTRFS